MQVWNLLHVARWKYRTEKLCKNRHLCTITQLCWAVSSQLRHISTITKKLVKQQYLIHISSEYGELGSTNDWDRLVSLGHSSEFERVSCLRFVTAPTSLNGGQPDFHDVGPPPGLVHYVYIFWALLSPNWILTCAKFTLCRSLAFSYIGSVTTRHSSSGRQPNFAAWYLHTTGWPSRSTFGRSNCVVLNMF